MCWVTARSVFTHRLGSHVERTPMSKGSQDLFAHFVRICPGRYSVKYAILPCALLSAASIGTESMTMEYDVRIGFTSCKRV